MQEIFERVLLARTNHRYGVLVEAGIGAGKTWLLRAIERNASLCGGSHTVYLCCSTLTEEHKGDLEVRLKAVFRLASEGGVGMLLLLDNLECLFQHNNDDGKRGVSSTSSFLLSAIDDFCQVGGFVVATCVSSASLPHGLTLTMRLGEPLLLPYPLAASRKAILQSLLTDVRIKVALDNSTNLDELCTELSLRTQGCSLGDMLQLVRKCVHNDLLRQCQDPGLPSSDSIVGLVHLSGQDLLEESYNIKPSVASSAASFLTSREGDAPAETLIGLEVEQERLKRIILDAVVSTADTLMNKVNYRVCRGVVIHGPSGTGKSSLAAWAAHQTKHRFRMLVVPCADLVNKVVGESERRIAECFQVARSMAPCLLLLDNIEFILEGGADGNPAHGLASRQRSSHVAIDRLLSSLLVEIDGLGDPAALSPASTTTTTTTTAAVSAAPVIVIVTAANMCKLDKALTRPGRLEEHIALNLPSLNDRFRLLSTLLAKFDKSRFQGPPTDEDFKRMAEEVATNTEGKSYAELVNLVERAAQQALSEFFFEGGKPPVFRIVC